MTDDPPRKTRRELKATVRSLTPVLACLAIAAAGHPAACFAQVFPAKIIRVIHPNQPGGNSDLVFRRAAGKMGEILGQQLVFDYRPGAGGNIGAELVAKSAPDGYTTLVAAASFVINPSLIRNLPYDTVKDFTPLGLIVDIPAAMVVHPSLGTKDVKELIALAKARPGQLFYSSSGAGAVGHLAGELLNVQAGIRLVHVPYKGIVPAVIDLIGGHVHLSFPSIAVVIENVRRGKLRMLAQFGAQRSPSLPDVPTMRESGYRDYVVTSGFNFMGPAGMPKPVVEKLNSALMKALQDPVVRADLLEQGADPVGNTPEQHATYIRTEIEKWRGVVKNAGIKIE